jgi:hypothetical protein
MKLATTSRHSLSTHQAILDSSGRPSQERASLTSLSTSVRLPRNLRPIGLPGLPAGLTYPSRGSVPIPAHLTFSNQVAIPTAAPTATANSANTANQPKGVNSLRRGR